jgi:hypothetical protein
VETFFIVVIRRIRIRSSLGLYSEAGAGGQAERVTTR